MRGVSETRLYIKQRLASPEENPITTLILIAQSMSELREQTLGLAGGDIANLSADDRALINEMDNVASLGADFAESLAELKLPEIPAPDDLEDKRRALQIALHSFANAKG